MEIKICKYKSLFAGIYKPPNLREADLTISLETIIIKLSNKCEKLILMGDFNMSTINTILSHFLDTLGLAPLNIHRTCFKNSKNQSYTDLLLTNFKPSFMKTKYFETGISDHHIMNSTIMRTDFTRKIHFKSPKLRY